MQIIIPVYKCTTYLTDCLESVFNQTFTDFEILLCFDNCEESIEHFKQSKYYGNDKIKAYSTLKHVYPYVIRNTLWQQTNDRVLFFDADDIMNHKMLEVLNNETSDIVYFKYCQFKDDINNCQFSESHARGAFYTNRKTFDITGGFMDWKCSADSEFMKRIELNKLDIKYSDHYLFYYRRHPIALTLDPRTALYSEYRKPYREYTKNLTEAVLKIETITTNIITI